MSSFRTDAAAVPSLEESPSERRNSASPSVTKLRKIPPIPTRQRAGVDEDGGFDLGKYDSDGGDSHLIEPSTLGLNQIRTRSAPLTLENVDFLPRPQDSENLERRGNDEAGTRPKLYYTSRQSASTSTERGGGKREHWHSKSLKVLSPRRLGSEGYHAVFAKEMQSPRFQAILRLTSGRKKRAPDIKSFSHELDSKGVRPLPFWKSRALGRMEEIMVMVRSKFDKLKEEVNADLGIFAGDLVSVLEKTSEYHPDWKECLEDLLVIARQCAKMSPGEFWIKCEAIVQNLDDRRQELPMGTLKQMHTRLIFILTRCTRLVQFHKENGYEEDHVLAYKVHEQEES